MKLQLLDKHQENSEATSFLFKPEVKFDFKPGQFLRYHISDPKPDERSDNRFFSIASAPFENIIRLTTKFDPSESSTFKNDLQSLRIGDFVEAFGPSGSFIVEDKFVSEGKKLCFIAGGIGITPFRSIILDLDHREKLINLTLLYANRTQNPLFKEEFNHLAAKHPEFKIYYIISDQFVTATQDSNIDFLQGKIDAQIIQNLVPNFDKTTFYISGPEPMVMTFEEMLKKLGIVKESIKRDYFPGYQQY